MNQYKAWKPFLFASTILALALAFVAEPLAVYIKQYQLISWKFIYSFPLYIVLAVLGKLVADKLLSLQNQSLQIATQMKLKRKQLPIKRQNSTKCTPSYAEL